MIDYELWLVAHLSIKENELNWLNLGVNEIMYKWILTDK